MSKPPTIFDNFCADSSIWITLSTQKSLADTFPAHYVISMRTILAIIVCHLCTLSNANEITRYTQTLLNNLGYTVGAADRIYGKKL